MSISGSNYKMTESPPAKSIEIAISEDDIDKHIRVDQDSLYEYIPDQTKDQEAENLARFHDINTTKLKWKKDLFVLIPLFVLYLVANINRSHTGILWTLGIKYTLNMDETRSAGAVAAFYVPYVFGQLFSNFILRLVRPHFYISICTLIYGSLVFSTGFVNSYGAYVACEFLHGLFQSGCDSAIFYILSSYYERRHVQKRVSFIYSANCLGMLINILVARDIKLNLPNPGEGWRWMLKIEGPITMFMALLMFFLIPDFPEGNRFLSDNETIFIIKELEIYSGKSGYNIPFTVKDILRALNCPLVWCTAFATHCFGSVSTGMSLFAPVGLDVQYFGGSRSHLSVDVWLVAFLVVNAFGWISDFTQRRFLTLLAACCLMLAALIGIFARPRDYGTFRYNMTVVCLAGAFSAYALFVGWSTFNFNGHIRRSIVTSVLIALCDASGIYGPFAANQLFTVGISFACGATLSIFIYFILLVYKNREKQTTRYKEKFSSYSEKRQILEGDRRPDYRYMY